MSEVARTVSRKEREVVHAIALDAALAEVVSTLREDGIRPLLIKGPAVARWLYDDPTERPYGDVDLLVDPGAYPAAAATLVRIGYRALSEGLRSNEQSPNESAWWRDGQRRVWVDLHQWVMLIPRSPDVAWRRLTEGAQPLVIAGVQIDTPSAPAHLLILALHAAHHGPAWPKPLEDLRRAIARVDLATWQAAAALATDLGAGGALREGLRLVAGGAELADRLVLADDASRAVRLSARSSPGTAAGFEHLLSTRGWRARLTLLAREVVPSPAGMRIWRRFADRGPLFLTLAYLWRPVWLLSQVPSSAAAWIATAPSGARYARFPAFVSGATWALRAWWRCRGQLRRGGLGAISLPAPPPERPGAQNGIRRVLRRVPASCLERSLVRQSWHSAHGRPRQVVIGVRGPAVTPEAHAWLDGDPEDPKGFTELARWPPRSDAG